MTEFTYLITVRASSRQTDRQTRNVDETSVNTATQPTA